MRLNSAISVVASSSGTCGERMNRTSYVLMNPPSGLADSDPRPSQGAGRLLKNGPRPGDRGGKSRESGPERQEFHSVPDASPARRRIQELPREYPRNTRVVGIPSRVGDDGGALNWHDRHLHGEVRVAIADRAREVERFACWIER